MGPARQRGQPPEEGRRPGPRGPLVLSEAQQIHEIYERLVSMGVRCYTEPSTNVLTNYGPITVFFCEDPDGNQVEVIALPSHEEVKEFRARTMGQDVASH